MWLVSKIFLRLVHIQIYTLPLNFFLAAWRCCTGVHAAQCVLLYCCTALLYCFTAVTARPASLGAQEFTLPDLPEVPLSRMLLEALLRIKAIKYVSPMVRFESRARPGLYALPSWQSSPLYCAAILATLRTAALAILPFALCCRPGNFTHCRPAGNPPTLHCAARGW